MHRKVYNFTVWGDIRVCCSLSQQFGERRTSSGIVYKPYFMGRQYMLKCVIWDKDYSTMFRRVILISLATRNSPVRLLESFQTVKHIVVCQSAVIGL